MDYTFQDWLNTTLELQRFGFGNDPTEMVDDRLADWMMMNLHAAHCELAEMGDEIGWKPWSKPRGWVNRKEFILEAVDTMHFIANALIAVECTGEELTNAYRAKVQTNYERQARDDDVRRRICSGCGRSIDEVGTRSKVVEWDSANRPLETIQVCAMCGKSTKGL